MKIPLQYLFMFSMISFALAACKNGDDDGNSKSTREPGDVAQGDINESDAPSGNDDDSGDENIRQLGTLSIDLGSSVAVGVAELDDSSSLPTTEDPVTISLALTATPQTMLTKFAADGTIVGVPLPGADDSAAPKPKTVVTAGEHGLILQTNRPGLLPEVSTDLIWINTQGQGKAIIPEGYSGDFHTDRMIYADDDRLWILDKASTLWKFDFNDASFQRISGSGQIIDNFIVASDGNLYLQGRVTSTAANFLRRLKPDGGFEALTGPQGAVTLDDASTFGRKLMMANRVGEVVDDALVYHYLPGAVRSPYSLIGNSWAVSYKGDIPSGYDPSYLRFAVDLASDKAVGNPFVATTATNQSIKANRVDTVNGLYYDGANVVSFAYGAGTSKLTLHRKLLYPNGANLQIERLFGPDHGFDSNWYGLAKSPDRKYFWVEVNSETGVVDVAGRTQFASAANLPTMIYRLIDPVTANELLIYYADTGAPQASLGLIETAGDQLVLTEKTSVGAAIDIATRGYAWPHAGKLYMPGDQGIQVYAPFEDDAVTGKIDHNSATPIFSPLASLEGGTLTACNSFRTFKAIVPTTDAGKPAVLVRLCNSNGSDYGEIAYLPLTDETFSTVDTDGMISGFDLSRLQTDDDRSFLEPIRDEHGNLLFLNRKEAVMLVPTVAGSSIERELKVDRLETDGFVPFGAKNPAQFDSVEIAAPWTGTAFLAGGVIDNEYRSFRVKLDERTETQVTALDGVQIYTAGLTSAGTLLVNGLRTFDNVKITARFDPDGALLSTDESSNIKLLQIVPFGN